MGASYHFSDRFSGQVGVLYQHFSNAGQLIQTESEPLWTTGRIYIFILKDVPATVNLPSEIFW